MQDRARLANLSVVLRTDNWAIVENDLTKMEQNITVPDRQGCRAHTRENIKRELFNLSNGLKSAVFKVTEQTLGKVVRSIRFHTEYEAEMSILAYTKTIANTVVQAVLSSTGFLAPIRKTVEKVVNRADDQYRLHDMEGALSIVADDEPLRGHHQSMGQSHRKYSPTLSGKRSLFVAVLVAEDQPSLLSQEIV